jgi:hypothetical protein
MSLTDMCNLRENRPRPVWSCDVMTVIPTVPVLAGGGVDVTDVAELTLTLVARFAPTSTDTVDRG